MLSCTPFTLGENRNQLNGNLLCHTGGNIALLSQHCRSGHLAKQICSSPPGIVYGAVIGLRVPRHLRPGLCEFTSSPLEFGIHDSGRSVPIGRRASTGTGSTLTANIGNTPKQPAEGCRSAPSNVPFTASRQRPSRNATRSGYRQSRLRITANRPASDDEGRGVANLVATADDGGTARGVRRRNLSAVYPPASWR